MHTHTHTLAPTHSHIHTYTLTNTCTHPLMYKTHIHTYTPHRHTRMHTFCTCELSYIKKNDLIIMIHNNINICKNHNDNI